MRPEEEEDSDGRCINLEKAAVFFADHGKKPAKELRRKIQRANYEADWDDADDMGCPPVISSTASQPSAAPPQTNPPASITQKTAENASGQNRQKPTHRRRTDFWTRSAPNLSNQVSSSSNRTIRTIHPISGEEMPEIPLPQPTQAPTDANNMMAMVPAGWNAVALVQQPPPMVYTGMVGGGGDGYIPLQYPASSACPSLSSATLEAFAAVNQRLSGNCSTMQASMQALLDHMRVHENELAHQAQEIERMKWSMSGARNHPPSYGGYPPANYYY